MLIIFIIILSFSGLLLSSDKYKLSFRELFGFDTEVSWLAIEKYCNVMNNKVAVTLLFSVCLHCILQDDDLQLFLLEYPLRTLVMVAQVQAGMWRRNGYAVINQVDKTIAGF